MNFLFKRKDLRIIRNTNNLRLESNGTWQYEFIDFPVYLLKFQYFLLTAAVHWMTSLQASFPDFNLNSSPYSSCPYKAPFLVQVFHRLDKEHLKQKYNPCVLS